MVDTTEASRSLSREEAADELEALADELRGSEDIAVAVGNKSVALAPQDTVDYDIAVSEREPMLGDKRESVSIDLHWKAEG